MLKAGLGATTKMLAISLVLLSMMLSALVGCESKKLVDQGDAQIGAIVESIQANFAEEGWTYTGFEVLGTDEENDTATVSIAYAIEGDAKDILNQNISEKPDDDAVYDLADDINAKVTVELSAYDKDNDALGCELISTEWFIGDTEANAWIQEQNKK